MNNVVKDYDNVDVTMIMNKIKEKIKKNHINTSPSIDANLVEIDRDYNYINLNWETHNNSYFISSHRPIIGKALVKGRILVHGEVKRYIDPSFFKQNEFNGSIVRILNDIANKFISTTSTIAEQDSQLNEFASEIQDVRSEIQDVRSEIQDVRSEIQDVRSEIQDVRSEIQDVRSEIQDQNNKICELKSHVKNNIAEQVRGIVAEMNEDIENRAWLAGMLGETIKKEFNNMTYDEIPNSNDGYSYFVFEERFRGSREDIKERETTFLPFFENCSNVLDILCGRGAFLELLRDKGVGSYGIDVDGDMVKYCKSIGLDVEQIDAISHLYNVDDKSLDGIFLGHVAEHLDIKYLINMFKLCYDKLIYGHYIILETANPLSLTSFINFYTDLTHHKPLHPDTLKFLMEVVGFREIEIRFYMPISDDKILRKIDSKHMDSTSGNFVQIYNHNIDLLNNILYGPQDYAIIGKK